MSNDTTFSICYELRGLYHCIIVWQIRTHRETAYVWALISTGAFPPDTLPKKALHYSRFIQAWRDAMYAMTHERRAA